jgi:DNA adenine methylase
MRYMGSKSRFAKYIAPILMKGHDQTKPYIEPFVGGGNMIDKVPASIRWGSDIEKYAVSFLTSLSEGWLPPEHLSEDEYNSIRRSPGNFDPALVGFAAYACSYSGKFWGGYGRNGNTQEGRLPFQVEAYNNALKQAPFLKGVKFQVSPYDQIDFPDGSTVYMDPPYAGTTKYKFGSFDHDKFWGFCASLSSRCRVFVSEYNAPPNWLPVWQMDTASSLTKNTGGKRGLEKLFTMATPRLREF